MKKTSEWVRELRARMERELRDEREVRENSISMMEKVANAGLLDDVEPDGPAPTDRMTVQCGHCGRVLEGPVYTGNDWLEEHMSKCSSG